MKVIIDTNLWISFLIGHQTQLVRRMLTDMRDKIQYYNKNVKQCGGGSEFLCIFALRNNKIT